jgi:hypothetical protein
MMTIQGDASELLPGMQGVTRTASAPWGGRVWASCCMAAIVLADWLFYRQPIGWTLSLYSALLAMLIVARGGRMLRTRPGRIHIGLIAGLLIALVEYPGVLPIILLAVAFVSLSLLRRWTELMPARQWAEHILTFAVTGWVRAFVDASLVHKWLRRGGGRTKERYRHLV